MRLAGPVYAQLVRGEALHVTPPRCGAMEWWWSCARLLRGTTPRAMRAFGDASLQRDRSVAFWRRPRRRPLQSLSPPRPVGHCR